MNQKVLILSVFCGIFVCANATGNIGSVLSPIVGVKTGIINAVQKAVNAKFDAKLKALDSLSNLGGGSSSGGFGGLSSGGGHSLFGGLSGSNAGASSGSGNILGGGGSNPLALVHSIIRSFTGKLGGSSANSQSMSFDFGNDDGFNGDSSSTYDASANGLSSSSSSGGFQSSGGYDTNQYSSSSVQSGTQFSADTGYNYPAPQPAPQPIPYQPPAPTNNGYNYPAPQPIPQPQPDCSNGHGGSSGGLSGGSSSSGGISSSGGSSGGFGGLQNILGGFKQIPVQILTAKKGLINGVIDKKIAHFQKSSGGASY